MIVNWTLGNGVALKLTANLSAQPLSLATKSFGRVLWSVRSSTADALESWSVRWEIDEGLRSERSGA